MVTPGVTPGMRQSCHRDEKGNAGLDTPPPPLREAWEQVWGWELGGYLSFCQVPGWGCDQGERSSAAFPTERAQRLKSERATAAFTPEIGFLSLRLPGCSLPSLPNRSHRLLSRAAFQPAFKICSDFFLKLPPKFFCHKQIDFHSLWVIYQLGTHL